MLGVWTRTNQKLKEVLTNVLVGLPLFNHAFSHGGRTLQRLIDTYIEDGKVFNTNNTKLM